MNQSPLALSAEPLFPDVIPSKPVNSPYYTKYQDRVDSRRNRFIYEEQENRRSLLKEIHATRQLRVKQHFITLGF
jgi:hypothetical protein